MKAKRKKRWWRTVGYIVLSVAALCVLWSLFHQVMKTYEQSAYPAIGQYVEVDGQRMHVYIKGEGEHSIVLLSGLGTAAPALDFEPLINELAITNRVVVVEPLGYGWSDHTDKPRTVENIVEEIRAALQQADVEGPYVLMPHSLSGIYSMYYASTYPSEVKAVIGMDATLPQAMQYFHVPPMTLPTLFSAVAPTGLARLMVYANAQDYLPKAEEGLYSKESLKAMKVLSAWNTYNKSVIHEINEMQHTIDKTIHMEFPSTLPVLLFAVKEDRVIEGGKNNITFYESQLSNSQYSSIVILEGDHYLHWTHYREISEQVNEWLQKL